MPHTRRIKHVTCKLQEWEKQAIVDASRAGEKHSAIAFEFCVDVSTISYYARKAGLAPRGAGRWPRRLSPAD